MTATPAPDVSAGSSGIENHAANADSRLLRVVGTWALAAGIVNITIGGGIFRLPSGVYARLGSASPVAYLICGGLMALVVMCFAEAGSRVALTGGLYACVDVAFGPLTGFLAAVFLWTGMTAATAAVAVFFAEALTALVPALGATAARTSVVIVVLIALAGLNIAGVAQAARFNAVMTVAKLAPLGVVIIAGLVALKSDRLVIAQAPSLTDVSRGSIFLMFAFFGIESALVPSGEVKDPARTVPRAIGLAIALVVVVYLCIQLVTQSTLGAALADSTTPVADAAGALLGPPGRTLILVGSAISMLGYVSGMILAVPRVLYTFGRDGFLPRAFASVHSRFRTPHVAIVVQTAITAVLAATGTFDKLAIVASGSVLLVYGACAVGVVVLRRRNVHTAGTPFVTPLGGLVPLLAFIAIVWLLTSLTGKEWLALVDVALVALIVFAATQRSRSIRRAA